MCNNKNIVAPTSCKVKRNEYDSSYGNFVVLLTDDGKSILIAHMKNKSACKVGAKLKTGDFIGTMGNTGKSTGTHAHIEVENSTTWAYNKNLLNPNDYIDWNCFSNSVTRSFATAKIWKNGSTKETVYADTNKSTKIGILNKYETCTCLTKIDGMYLVLYKIDGTNNYKVGFVSYAGGC